VSAADSLAAIVLAAGGARRYGSPKALAPLRGQPMLQHVLDVLDGQCDVTLVLGADAASIGAALRLPKRVVVNDGWAEGLASSIKAGLDAIGDVPAVLMALGDQPAIERADYENLIAAWRRAPQRIAAAQYGDVLGAPCIFPNAFFDALRQLEGDRGASALLRQLHAQVDAIPMASALLDVDTPQDLMRLDDAIRRN
jgi:molybdenum cofactor cytidylyltransferase